MNKTKKRFLIFSVLLAAAVALIYFVPYKCPFESILGIYCSGCGISRAVRHIINFQFIAAFNCNQFFVLSLPLFLYFYIAAALKIFSGIKILPQKKYVTAFLIIYTALFILYGILRNFQAFYFLAPLGC